MGVDGEVRPGPVTEEEVSEGVAVLELGVREPGHEDPDVGPGAENGARRVVDDVEDLPCLLSGRPDPVLPSSRPRWSVCP